MKTLTNAQEQKLKTFGLTVKDIVQIEKSTGWCYAQHTAGGDIRFLVQKVIGKYEFVIWLHSSPESSIAIGVWADHDKRKIQEQFHKKLGAWCPNGMTSDGYANKGRNPERGHVGDWRAQIVARDFLKNLNVIRRMVGDIEKKLKETGLYDVLNNL